MDKFEKEWKKYCASKGDGAVTMNVKEVARYFYEQAEKDIAEHIKLAYGKVSMNPFDCSEAFEELLKTIGAV